MSGNNNLDPAIARPADIDPAAWTRARQEVASLAGGSVLGSVDRVSELSSHQMPVNRPGTSPVVSQHVVKYDQRPVAEGVVVNVYSEALNRAFNQIDPGQPTEAVVKSVYADRLNDAVNRRLN